ncbi:MAG TPA: hypothetical protein VHW04_23970 [Solirubrobacteraceae bacterium]|jgi:hypothetical protein|nr:hypothetical protein [Solirubrobacteraceae bacterium]
MAGTAAMTVHQRAVTKVRGSGASWGAVYALTDAIGDTPAIRRGIGVRYGRVRRKPARAARDEARPPVWEYPPLELVLEVSYHLVYGIAVAAAYPALGS